MKIVRKIIKIDEALCDGCGQCIIGCAEGALKLIDGKARVIADKFCDGLGACIGECPTGALKIIEREAEEFDEEAVEAHLTKQQSPDEAVKPLMRSGCPSAGVEIFAPGTAATKSAINPSSALGQWPVQIRLVPAKAPFLKGADLLVLADCGAVAFPTLHQDLLKGRVVVMGCPKFDDATLYIRKFAEFFTVADIKSVTAVIMEVPCCAGLPQLVAKGMETAGKDVPMELIVVSTRGQVLRRGNISGC